MIQYIGHVATSLISSAGYLGLFVLSAIESCGIPIPSELVLPFSGFLSSTGAFSLALVVLVASVGNLVGSIALYGIGHAGGRWILERYGKFVFIHKEDLDYGDQWFRRFGTKAVFWSRLMPIVRTFISLPAGISQMPFVRFCVYTILGALPWNFALAFIGYKAGEHWDSLHKYFQRADYLIGVLVIIIVIVVIIKKSHRGHK